MQQRFEERVTARLASDHSGASPAATIVPNGVDVFGFPQNVGLAANRGGW